MDPSSSVEVFEGFPRTLCITGLRDTITEDILKEEFSRFGQIQKCHLFYLPNSKKHTGLATISFQLPIQARTAKKNMSQQLICGQPISIHLEFEGGKSSLLYQELLNQVFFILLELTIYFTFFFSFKINPPPVSNKEDDLLKNQKPSRSRTSENLSSSNNIETKLTPETSVNQEKKPDTLRNSSQDTKLKVPLPNQIT